MEPDVGDTLFEDSLFSLEMMTVPQLLIKIHEEVAYSVEKWSDSAHATRTLVNHLHKIRS